MSSIQHGDSYYTLTLRDLDNVIRKLSDDGYTVYGPVVQDGAIVYDVIGSVSQLPVGLRDVQGPGYYRLEKRGDNAYFGYVVGPHSWKKILYPAKVKLLSVNNMWDVKLFNEGATRMAFLGVRGCELEAIRVLDRVLLDGIYRDPVYKSRRENLFIIAVNCVEPGSNCFCTSMGTGPEAKHGYDISLTEVREGDRHFFLAKPKTAAGLKLLKEIGAVEAGEEDVAAAQKALRGALSKFSKKLVVKELREKAYREFEGGIWSEIAGRCLACGNCTLVCPTCFCTTIEDTNSLDMSVAERWRRWDSCFTSSFSYIHGGPIRSSIGSRYRQWFMHKLVTWVDQFGLQGCVGCGRCITWCPVGIDITEEAARLDDKT